MTWTTTDREHESVNLDDAGAMLIAAGERLRRGADEPFTNDDLQDIKSTLYDVESILREVSSDRNYRDYIPGDEAIQPHVRNFRVKIIGYVDDGDLPAEEVLYQYSTQGARHKVNRDAQELAQKWIIPGGIITGARAQVDEILAEVNYSV